MTRKTFRELVERNDKARAEGAAMPQARERQRRATCPPALTGGESPARLRSGAKVDWLTVTWLPEPDECLPRQVHDFLVEVLGDVQGLDAPGMLGYESGVRYFIALDDGKSHHVARLDFGGNHHKGRARLDLSGSACSKVRDWLAVHTWIGQQFDYTLTRVDLAVDCLNGEFDVEDARDWYLAGEFNAGGRMPRHSTPGDWFDPKYGRTLEVGRRENGKMLRAYEKGRQLGDPQSPWTRFEVEIRNKDRDIPLDVLIRCNEHFVGAYRCLERVLDAAAERIRTHQAEGEIALENLVIHSRQAYGRLVHTLRASLTADEVITCLSLPGVPKRLEKASLGGFQVAASPSAYLSERTRP
ncbi:MAG: replication initiation factor domain-containing protein [Aquabacterium sp.]|uniref:replication initiation factor domain-containing protein n=1 Tax=Aquabacterium sp. TaxID=1872578 RepID=UPI003BBB506F